MSAYTPAFDGTHLLARESSDWRKTVCHLDMVGTRFAWAGVGKPVSAFLVGRGLQKYVIPADSKEEIVAMRVVNRLSCGGGIHRLRLRPPPLGSAHLRNSLKASVAHEDWLAEQLRLGRGLKSASTRFEE